MAESNTFVEVPTTPMSGMRNRSNPANQRIAGEFIFDDPSPTLSSVTASPHDDTGNLDHTHHLNDTLPRPSAFRASQFQPAARKVMIRSDPALLTCFDPISEKALYDLWAPKR